MTLICTIKFHLETIVESLTELAQDYDSDSLDCEYIMCAVEAVQQASLCLSIVGASQ